MYSGSIGKGLVVMFAYWGLQALNALLMFVLIGFVTMPLTWLAFMIWSPIDAARNANRPRGYLSS
jgi:TM2 domain-containing membrane protein YozV